MKIPTIVVQPYLVSDPKKFWGYPIEMRVVKSNHPRFVKGTRFDYGFHDAAMTDGYRINYLLIRKEDPSK